MTDTPSINLDNNPVKAYVREKTRQYNDNDVLISPMVSNNEKASQSMQTAHPVPYFWKDPFELLYSRLLCHSTGKVKNKNALYTNATMTIFTSFIVHLSDPRFKTGFWAFQIVGTCIDLFLNKKSVEQLTLPKL